MSARERLERTCGPTPPPELVRDIDAHAAEVLRKAEAKLRERAAEYSDLAEEKCRPSLEERAQEWHFAADVLSRMADETEQEKATPEGEATPTTTGWTHVDGFPVQCPHCHTTQSHCNACGTDMYDQPTEGAS